MSTDKYSEYREKLFLVLDSLRMPNGTFRASNSDEYNATWIRDSYYCNNAYLGVDNTKYLQTCHTYLDFLHKWNTEYDSKITWLTKEVIEDSENAYKFIHPKHNFDGSEIAGLQWQFRQEDSFPYLILMMWGAYSRGLEVFRTEDDIEIMQTLVTAMENTRYWEVEYAHSWEEETACFLSNILLSMYATERAYEMGFSVDRESLRKARRKAYGQFPYERTGRNFDLTLLFPCILEGFLPRVDVDDILKGCIDDLKRTHYMCRYIGDIYKPFRNEEDLPTGEMEWCMSGGFLSIICSLQGRHELAKGFVEGIMQEYPEGDIPEGVNSQGKRCYNEVLAWSVSMYIQAINKILGVC